MSGLKAKLRKYFSGKLVIVQVCGGVGAFVGRSVGAYSTDVTGQADWAIVSASLAGSFAGYIGTYIVGYWWFFRREYAGLDRSMGRDIVGLQVIEQSPNIWTVISAAVGQGLLMQTADVDAVVSANLASWFGPHKIINLIAMVSSNSAKKAWVDHTWSPGSAFRRLKWWVRRKPDDDAETERAAACVEMPDCEAPTPEKYEIGDDCADSTSKLPVRLWTRGQ